MKTLFIAAAVLPCSVTSGYTQAIVTDDPAITVCEHVVKSKLKSPSSYKRIGGAVGKNMAALRYDATNEFNATIRDLAFCYFRIDQNGMWRLKSDDPLDIDAAFDSGAQPIPQSKTKLGTGE